MSGKIFINYRRGDDPGATGRLFDRLVQVFQPEQLFMDVEDGIPAGADFLNVLGAKIEESDIILAVVGRNWLTIEDDEKRPRLQNEDDLVRFEIRTAIERGKLIVPILVGGATMPRADQLPSDLEPLSRRHALKLSHERFQADCVGLSQALRSELDRLGFEKAQQAIDAEATAARTIETRQKSFDDMVEANRMLALKTEDQNRLIERWSRYISDAEALDVDKTDSAQLLKIRLNREEEHNKQLAAIIERLEHELRIAGDQIVKLTIQIEETTKQPRSLEIKNAISRIGKLLHLSSLLRLGKGW
jgi:hypothetical protein